MVYRAPEVSEKYLKFEIKGITFYISKVAAQGASDITFDIQGLLFVKNLIAKGIQYPKI